MKFFSDKGTVYSARAYKIPECSRTAAGTPLVQVFICPFSFLHALARKMSIAFAYSHATESLDRKYDDKNNEKDQIFFTLIYMCQI